MVSGKYRAKWLTFWNSVVHRRNSGMIVVLLAEKSAVQSEEQQIESLRDLSARVHAALKMVMEQEA